MCCHSLSNFHPYVPLHLLDPHKQQSFSDNWLIWEMVRRKIDRNQLGIYYWFFCVATVLSLAGVVSWLSLTPKNPVFRISDAHLPALDFSKNHSAHSNASVPNKSLFFDLEIFNPNTRMGIYYSGISLEFYSNGGAIGRNSTPAFYQGYNNTTLLHIVIHSDQEFRQTANGGNQDFIRVTTTVVFRIIKWKTKLRQIAYEEQLSKEKINLNGTVLGGEYTGQQNASNVKIRNWGVWYSYAVLYSPILYLNFIFPFFWFDVICLLYKPEILKLQCYMTKNIHARKYQLIIVTTENHKLVWWAII